jgi:hypothetical protein
MINRLRKKPLGFIGENPRGYLKEVSGRKGLPYMFGIGTKTDILE